MESTSSPEEFRPKVEARLQKDYPHLYEKWQDHLDKPMMQTALWVIMDVSESRTAAEQARINNQQIQSERQGT